MNEACRQGMRRTKRKNKRRKKEKRREAKNKKARERKKERKKNRRRKKQKQTTKSWLCLFVAGIAVFPPPVSLSLLPQNHLRAGKTGNVAQKPNNDNHNIPRTSVNSQKKKEEEERNKKKVSCGAKIEKQPKMFIKLPRGRGYIALRTERIFASVPCGFPPPKPAHSLSRCTTRPLFAATPSNCLIWKVWVLQQCLTHTQSQQPPTLGIFGGEACGGYRRFPTPRPRLRHDAQRNPTHICVSTTPPFCPVVNNGANNNNNNNNNSGRRRKQQSVGLVGSGMGEVASTH